MKCLGEKNKPLPTSSCCSDDNEKSPEEYDEELKNYSLSDDRRPDVQMLIAKSYVVRDRLFKTAMALPTPEEAFDAAMALLEKYPHYKDSRLLGKLGVKTNYLICTCKILLMCN